MAKAGHADALFILTDVDHVYIDFNQPEEKFLKLVSFGEVPNYYEEGQFSEGSKGPKVDACMRFVQWSGKEVIITTLDKALDALQGGTGTRIQSAL